MKLWGFLPIAKEGLKIILITLAFTIIAFIFLGPSILAFFFAIISIFTISFFRNPDRKIPQEENVIVAPADGKVVFVGEVNEDRFLKTKTKKVSIFMSVFNVHVNRNPISGTVKKISYNKGKFFNAAAPKASLDNEQNAIVIEKNDKQEVLFIQIAGLIARRIVCYLSEGQKCKIGDRMGLIKFGSRLDVYLPLDAKLNIKQGNKTKAGETIIAFL